MGDSYRVIGAGCDELECSTAAEFFEIARDMDEPDGPGVFTLHARSASDGIGVTGTPDELLGWLERAMVAVHEARARGQRASIAAGMERLRRAIK